MRLFVTGATGFIAKHVVLEALKAGHHVTGSTRNLQREAAMRAALARHLPPDALSRFRLVALDLTRDKGWAEAMEGCEALLHTAAPVPMRQPKDPDGLVAPAVEGTLRAMRAAQAAGIRRVIVTSSSSAITNCDPPGGVFTETCWTDPDAPGVTAYPRAKTLAERAAWEHADSAGMEMTSVNPAFVVGPPLDAEYGTSIAVFARLLKGRDPLLPRMGVTLIDVRDVAEAHVRALALPETVGARLFLRDRFLWIREVAALLQQACPERKVPQRVAPDLVVRLIALFSPEVRQIVPSLGEMPRGDCSATLDLLGMDLRDTRQSVRETGEVLSREGWIR